MCSIVKACCDPEWAFPVGLSHSEIFSDFTSDSPYKVTRLKGLWLNLYIISPRCSEFGGFFSDLCHVLEFVCCFDFYPHIFFILLLLEQQSPCGWFLDFNRDHGIYVVSESVRSLVGCCMGWTVVLPKYILGISSFHKPLYFSSLVRRALRMTLLPASS